MSIKVGENYKVDAIKNNVVLYEKFDHRKIDENIGEEEYPEEKVENGWKVDGYFSSVEGALLALLKREVEKSELKDLETILNRIKEVEGLIKDLHADSIRWITVKSLKDKDTCDKAGE
jgi:hypothetical protein